ncbi:hypothetical protein [Streptomyces sp. NPDC058086]|uniref:hypothetical protein n=1 Tax=Streptomyces sp. NPDC058086 TaxID=3346334 RepID=UPI0036E0504C
MPRFFSLAVLVATALAVATSAASATSLVSDPVQRPNPPDAVGIRLVDVPADLVKDPRARQYIIDSLKPGVTVKRRIEVSNKSADVLHVAVYPGAADIRRGAFVGAAGSTRNELTTWIKPSRLSLDVPAHSRARDTVTIAIPKDAAPGERYGVVWAQVSGRDLGSGITLVSRTGIRLYLSVGGNNPPRARFTVDNMTAERDASGRAVVHAKVHNTGGRALDLTGAMKMSQVSGSISAGPYPVDSGKSLAPGQSASVNVIVTDQVTDGPWDVSLTLKSGLLEVTKKARITFPNGPGMAAAVLSSDDQQSSLNWRLISASTALILVIFSTLVIIRTYRRSSGGDDS